MRNNFWKVPKLSKSFLSTKSSTN